MHQAATFDDLPNEILAAIFGAIDVNDKAGFQDFDRLRATSHRLRAVGDNLVLRAATSQQREHNPELLAMKDQLEDASLSNDERRDSHAVLRYLRDGVMLCDRRCHRPNRSRAIKLRGLFISDQSCRFSHKGRFLALADWDGYVSLIDMHVMKQQARGPSASKPINEQNAAVTRLPRLPATGQAATLAFSMDESTLVILYEDTYGSEQVTSPTIAVHDLLSPQRALKHRITLPQAARRLANIAVDARGSTLALAVRFTKELIHVRISPSSSESPEGTTKVRRCFLQDYCYEVAFDHRGVLFYKASWTQVRDPTQERALADLMGTSLLSCSRRPSISSPSFHYGSTSWNSTEKIVSQDGQIHLVRHDDDERRCHSISFHFRAEDDWNQESIEYMHMDVGFFLTSKPLISPDNRFILVNFGPCDAKLIDTAPPAILDAAPPARPEGLLAGWNQGVFLIELCISLAVLILFFAVVIIVVVVCRKKAGEVS